VAALQGRSQAVLASLSQAGLPAYDLGMAGRGDPRGVLRLFRLLRHERVRVLVTFLFHATLLGRVVGALAGVPVRVSSERTMGGEGWGRRLLNRWTVPLATHVVAVSDLVARHTARTFRIPDSRLSTIRNGVDVVAIQPTPRPRNPEAPVVGCTARLHAENDHATLLAGFARVAAGRPNARLLLVGRGPEEGRLRRLSEGFGIAQRVTFAGEHADVRPWLAAMDVYAQTSRTAGISNSILEAMAAALPVVATAVGGTPEVVVDGETGILVPGQDAAALAGALERLLGDAGARRAYGSAGRARVEAHFAEATMLGQVEALLDRLVRDTLGLRFDPASGWVPCQ
jgi:glycosyltransferase involved in cell wall biosynthesis